MEPDEPSPSLKLQNAQKKRFLGRRALGWYNGLALVIKDHQREPVPPVGRIKPNQKT